MQIRGFGVFGLAGCSWLVRLVSPVGTEGDSSDGFGYCVAAGGSEATSEGGPGDLVPITSTRAEAAHESPKFGSSGVCGGLNTWLSEKVDVLWALVCAWRAS